MWSPDGAQLLYQESYGWSTRYNLVGAQSAASRPLIAAENYKHHPLWSPDGARLAYLTVQAPGDPSGQKTCLEVVEIANGKIERITEDGIVDFIWSPLAESLLAVIQADSAVRFVEVFLGGQASLQLSYLEFPPGAWAISLSPDGRWLLYILLDQEPTSMTDQLVITSLDGSQVREIGRFTIDSTLAWAPDSSRLAYVSLGEDFYHWLYLVEIPEGESRPLLQLDTGDESGEILPGTPAWSSDNQTIAIPSFVNAAGSAILVLDADGSNLRQVTEPSGLIYDVAWKPR